MAKQELIDWFKNYLSQGYSIQHLINYLIKQGFDPNDVNEAAEIANSQQKTVTGEQKVPEQLAPTAPESKTAESVQKPSEIADAFTSKPSETKETVVPKPTAVETLVQKQASPEIIQKQHDILEQEIQKTKSTKPINLGIFLVIGIIILAIAAFAIYSFLINSDFFNRPLINETNQSNVIPIIEPNVSPSNTTQSNFSAPAICDNTICFVKNFKECANASAIFQQDNKSIRYVILKSAGELCNVEVEYSVHPDSGFIGKKMVCGFNKSMDFEFALQNLDNCKGELYYLILVSKPRPENCKLKTAFSSLDLNTNTTFGVLAYGFKNNATDVSWKSLNESIATVSPSQGALVFLKAIRPGSTKIFATDNSIGLNCTIAVNVSVK